MSFNLSTLNVFLRLLKNLKLKKSYSIVLLIKKYLRFAGLYIQIKILNLEFHFQKIVWVLN